jgi:GDSL-like Lipase/Acylhydrolase family
MRARRVIILAACIAVLAACGAASSATDSSDGTPLRGVGVLPDQVSQTTQRSVASTTSTTIAAETTTTLPVNQPIGKLVSGNRLLMIGDSITASASRRYTNDLCNALVPLGWQVEVDAESSRFIDFGARVLDKRWKAGWDAVYIFLGTNYGGDQQKYRQQLEKLVQRVAPTPVVLLTITEFEDNRRQVNDVIALVKAQFPNVHVVDWSNIAAADADTILVPDGHHLTTQGRVVLGETMASVMGTAPSQPGDCLKTSYNNDSGGDVNGSNKPSPKKVGKPTPPVAKPTTPTTVKPGVTTTIGGVTPTTKPTSATTTPPATSQAPPPPAPTTQAPPPPTTPAPPTTQAPPTPSPT